MLAILGLLLMCEVKYNMEVVCDFCQSGGKEWYNTSNRVKMTRLFFC
jgi:hypothetical protein